MKILIVDDNADVADSLAILLQGEGHEVRTSYSGEDALIAAAEFGPRIVLLDIAMPGMSGREVAQGLRKNHIYGDLTLVAVTGLAEPDDIWTNKDAGFDFHITKPAYLADIKVILHGLE